MTGELFLVGLIRALAWILWLAVIVFIGYAILRKSRNNPLRNFFFVFLLIVLIAIITNIIAAGLVFIQPLERGVVITIAGDGVRDQALQPGLKWVIPYAEKVVIYSISRQTYTMSSQIIGDDSVEARTSDGQIVLVNASVLFSVDPNAVISVHIHWRDRYIDGLVRPRTRGVIRDAVSHFSTRELNMEDSQLENMVSEELQAIFQENGLILVDFEIQEIMLSNE